MLSRWMTEALGSLGVFPLWLDLPSFLGQDVEEKDHETEDLRSEFARTLAEAEGVDCPLPAERVSVVVTTLLMCAHPDLVPEVGESAIRCERDDDQN